MSDTNDNVQTPGATDDANTNTNTDANTDQKLFPESHVLELRKESAKYRNQVRDLQTKIEEMEKKFSGVDLSEIEKLKAEQDRLEREKAEKNGEWEKLASRMQAEHAKALQDKDSLITNLQKTIERLEADLGDTILRNEISIAAASAKAINPRYVEMAIMSEAVVRKDDNTGRRSIFILDTDGTERISTKTAKPMTVAERIAELKMMEEHAHLFEGATFGAGSRNSFQGKAINNPWKKETFNLTLQGQIFKSDPGLAEKLKAEANRK